MDPTLIPSGSVSTSDFIVPLAWQKLALEKYDRDHRYWCWNAAVREPEQGHGRGTGRTMAAILLMRKHLMTHGDKALVLVAFNVLRQVNAIFWPYCQKVFGGPVPVEFGERIVTGTMSQGPERWAGLDHQSRATMLISDTLNGDAQSKLFGYLCKNFMVASAMKTAWMVDIQNNG